MEVIEERTLATIKARIARCKAELQDLDILISEAELVLRTPAEYLLVQQHRSIKLSKMKDEARAALSAESLTKKADC